MKIEYKLLLKSLNSAYELEIRTSLTDLVFCKKLLLSD